MLFQRLKQLRSWITLLCGVLLIFLFQNCAGEGGFKAATTGSVDLGSSGSAQVPDVATPTPVPTATATPTPTITPTPSPTPTPTPVASTLKKTYFYFGRSKGIDSLELDHGTGQVRSVASVSFSGSNVGWLNYEPTGKSILASDADGSVLQIYSQNLMTGALASVNAITNFAASIVHLTMQPSPAGGFDLFASSYGRGALDYYKLNQAKTQVTTSQRISFGGNAKTHSSSFDSKRNLLYVASLGLNKIDVYNFNGTTLSALTSIAVDSPRTVVYDSQYDKLYVSTEAYAGNSFIRIFSIAAAGNSYTYTGAGSLAMPLAGGDIKVNRAMGYIMATAREVGKEAILALPVTAEGIEDKSRTSFSMAVTQRSPRALEITEDGLYAVVGMNSATAENVVAYKMTFDAQKKYVSSQKTFQSRIDTTQGYLSGLSIPSY